MSWPPGLLERRADPHRLPHLARVFSSSASPSVEATRRTNPVRQKFVAKHKAAIGEFAHDLTWSLDEERQLLTISFPLVCYPRPFTPTSACPPALIAPLPPSSAADDTTAGGDGTAAQPGAGGPTKRAQLQMPDEYLPPNKVLFLQNLPEGTSKEDLQEVFEQCVMAAPPSFDSSHRLFARTPRRHPNLLEVRLIPTRRDIAFVEYTDEDSAVVAKEALHNFKIDGETKMKVTYARK